MKKLLAALLCVSILCSFAFGTVGEEVVGDQSALTDALHRAGAEDIILVGDMNFVSGMMGMTLSKSVTVKGAGETPAVFADGAFAIMGGGTDSVRVVFENIAFQGGVSMRPAFFFNRNVEAVFHNCSFSGYNWQNGAIYGIYSDAKSLNYHLSLRFVDCDFADNCADFFGGALYLSGQDNVDLVLQNCKFLKNTAQKGGALFADGISAVLEYCTFGENSGQVRGGALCLQNSDITMENCYFLQNESQDGGALFLQDTETFAASCVFSENQAGTAGGAVWNQNTANNGVTFLHTTFSGNTALSCGSVFLEYAEPEIGDGGPGRTYLEHCTFTDNTPPLSCLSEAVTASASAFYGELADDMTPSAENAWCYATQTSHGGEMGVHLASNIRPDWDSRLAVGDNAPLLTAGNPFGTLLWILAGLCVACVVFAAVVLLRRKPETESATECEEPDIGLTAREQEVFELLLAGKTRKQIAETLFISEHTVKDHVTSVYRKMGVNNRTELLLLKK